MSVVHSIGRCCSVYGAAGRCCSVYGAQQGGVVVSVVPSREVL